MKFLVRLVGVVAEIQMDVESDDQNAAIQSSLALLQQGTIQLKEVKPYVIPLVMPVTDVDTPIEQPKQE